MGISKIFYVLVLAIVISGCGIDKMAGKYETVSYTVTPSPLETHGGEVALNLNGTFATNYYC